MTTSKSYNGHKNYNFWNVSLWLNNDYGLYQMIEHVSNCSGPKTKAAQNMLDELNEMGITQTPDGVKYTKSAIAAAMVGIEK